MTYFIMLCGEMIDLVKESTPLKWQIGDFHAMRDWQEDVMAHHVLPFSLQDTNYAIILFFKFYIFLALELLGNDLKLLALGKKMSPKWQTWIFPFNRKLSTKRKHKIFKYYRFILDTSYAIKMIIIIFFLLLHFFGSRIIGKLLILLWYVGKWLA